MYSQERTRILVQRLPDFDTDHKQTNSTEKKTHIDCSYQYLFIPCICENRDEKKEERNAEKCVAVNSRTKKNVDIKCK